jgi:hypothetical protein
MAGFLIDPIRRAMRESARKKRVRLAANWPQVTAKINLWKVLPVEDETESFAQTDFIEGGFSFLLNGEYYGGYVRSIPMGRHQAEKQATGEPSVIVRYNPANPDQTVVLAEDNGGLPFEVISG